MGGKKMLKDKIKLNLQMFSDDGQGQEGGNGSEGNGSEEPIQFKSKSEFDAALDKHAEKALKTAREKWERESKEREEKVKTEAERLAQMTEKERQEALKAEREKELAEREAELNRRELKANSLLELSERKLPTELIDVLVFTDAEACKKSIDALDTAFKKAVDSAVDERLKTSTHTPAGDAGFGSIRKSMPKLNEHRIVR